MTFKVAQHMDPIRLLLSLVLGLFPQLLYLTAVPLAVVPRRNQRSRQQLCDYAIGHDWFGWYRVTLEIHAVGWPALRVIAVYPWSRLRPGQSRGTLDRISLSDKRRNNQSGSPDVFTRDNGSH